MSFKDFVKKSEKNPNRTYVYEEVNKDLEDNEDARLEAEYELNKETERKQKAIPITLTITAEEVAIIDYALVTLEDKKYSWDDETIERLQNKFDDLSKKYSI